jgi:predicted Fe-Mo cluster-binding NifX family protein
MKIAVALKKSTPTSEIDPRFGRCAYFLFYDTDTEEQSVLKNGAGEASSGAGTQAAQWLADQGAQVVIAAEFGPKALSALDSGGLLTYLATGGNGEQAIEDYLQSRLKPASQPGERGRGHGHGRGRGRRGV